MTAPTGNVWRDPDTGKPANPKNVQQDQGTGIPVRLKYGPGVMDTGRGSEVDETPFQRIPEAEQVDLTPGRPVEGPIVDRKYGPVSAPAKPDQAKLARAGDALKRDLIAVRDWGHESQDKKVSPEQRRRARLALEKIAANEFARDGGPRKEIANSLKRFGIAGPPVGAPSAPIPAPGD